MSQTQESPSIIHSSEPYTSCPIHQKTNPSSETSVAPVVLDENGIWYIYGFEEARTILRSKDTYQAGFNAEQMMAVPGLYNRPILYQEGKEHQQQRKQIAYFLYNAGADSTLLAKSDIVEGGRSLERLGVFYGNI